MQLAYEEEVLIRELILDGRSDVEIAQVLLVSVKLIRPIRAELEEELRPD